MAKSALRIRDAAGIAARKLVVWISGNEKDVASSPVISSGSAAPSDSNPDGSIYLRTAGDKVTTLYVKESSAYTAVPIPAKQTIDMADAALAIVHGTAGAGEVKLTGNLLFVDPNSGGASEDLTLPPEATSSGLLLFIFNTGGEGIVVKDDGGGTVITLDTAQHGVVACDGTSWIGFMGGVT